jgi:beta-fructofuranosidase
VEAAEETVIILSRPAQGSHTGMLHLDRTRSSLDPAVDVEEKSGPVPMTDGRVRLRVLVDRSAVEIFANGKPLTARVYPTLGGERVTLAATEGSVRLLSFDAWTMAGVFGSTRSRLPERK